VSVRRVAAQHRDRIVTTDYCTSLGAMYTRMHKRDDPALPLMTITMNIHDDDDVYRRQWRQFHEACPPVAHVAEVTSPDGEEPVDHVLTVRACDSPISRRHVYTSRGHRVVVALMTSSHESPLHLFVQYQGRTFLLINFH